MNPRKPAEKPAGGKKRLPVVIDHDRYLKYLQAKEELERLQRKQQVRSRLKVFFARVTVIPWIVGIVLADGFWLSVLAWVFPPYAVYLTIMAVINHVW